MDPRRELAEIRKHYRQFQRTVGEAIVWFEFLPIVAYGTGGLTNASGGLLVDTDGNVLYPSNVTPASMYDDVYSEGVPSYGGRTYAAGVVVPVLLITETEDQERSIPEGRQTTQVTNFVASIQDFRDAGITTPFEYQLHLNDMFQYDGRYFGVTSYRVRGRAMDDVMIVVEGIEIYIDQEMINDPGPDALQVVNLPWPSSLPNIS